MMPPQMPSKATSSPPKIPWVRRIRMIPTTTITSLSGKPRRSPCGKAHNHGYPPGAKYSGLGETDRTDRAKRMNSGRSGGSGGLLRRDVAPDLLHVETLDRLDQLLKRRGRQGPGLGKHENAVPEGHQ